MLRYDVNIGDSSIYVSEEDSSIYTIQKPRYTMISHKSVNTASSKGSSLSQYLTVTEIKYSEE